ncbi:MAG: helix-turn-helix domain-containing protein [Sphingobium sp.]|nr:helix-turn-helix domain-containing protein [Sphingobium sp.]
MGQLARREGGCHLGPMSSQRSYPHLDLCEVEHEQRLLTWNFAARSIAPGLSVRMVSGTPTRGSLEREQVGTGQLIYIQSAPANVTYRPSKYAEGSTSYFSLMFQRRGSILANQSHKTSALCEGDIWLIDESKAFSLNADGSTDLLLLRLPRLAVIGRYPQFQRLEATVLSARETGTRLLADTLTHLAEGVSQLCEVQRAAMMNAIVQMLGVAEPSLAPEFSMDWRIRRAIDFIELNLSVPGLTAEAIAQDQRISRRRLDQLMQKAFGQSIAGYLWKRRLDRAATDLQELPKADMSIAQVAFANGFEDAAHFTRAFKKRFSMTPGNWRTP